MDASQILLLLGGLALAACAPVRSVADDDDTTTDAPRGCAVADVLGPACTDVPVQTVVLDAWCDDAIMQPLMIRDLVTWQSFLLSCDADQVDPLEGLDWSAYDVVGTLATSGGCNGTAGTAWLARCDDGHHLSYWSTGCGACDAIWTTTHFLVVATGEGVETLELAPCVPTGQECE